jgi:hypothetical protein
MTPQSRFLCAAVVASCISCGFDLEAAIASDSRDWKRLRADGFTVVGSASESELRRCGRNPALSRGPAGALSVLAPRWPGADGLYRPLEHAPGASLAARGARRVLQHVPRVFVRRAQPDRQARRPSCQGAARPDPPPPPENCSVPTTRISFGIPGDGRAIPNRGRSCTI